MIRVAIVGRGRVGGALAANLTAVDELEVATPVGRDADITRIADSADMVLLAVTDGAVASVAATIARNDEALFVHFAGSLTLAVLAPHVRRASLHPLTPMPGDPATAAARLRGAWMAVAGDADVMRLADALDARTFAVDEAHRARYHATATIAASHVAGLMGQVARNAAVVGVPLAAYLDLSLSTLANVEALGPAAALTGPIVRGDWETVRAHLASLSPDDRITYLALAAEAARLAGSELPTDLNR
ncbi:MAG TPA: DUF2520 domain-containing protein [Ilumatobacteraceae bacterium]|nr:DUF2520 domain-containing protein [Ilumatobacteraceae bacterium]